jgi:hypothetical protein
MDTLRKLEINGGTVTGRSAGDYHLTLPPVSKGYADAQIDDYGGRKRSDYPWQSGTRMSLEARFSHNPDQLLGTAGFGFWNAPYGDPTAPWTTLPQAAWYFYGSPPNDLPLALEGVGRGWFASTINARSLSAISLIPATPAVLLLNQIERLRRRIWPRVRERLGITFQPLPANMTDWHQYRLDWQAQGCTFLVDGQVILKTNNSPGGPLGFVCWLDNQYLVVTVRGRFAWGTIPTSGQQSLFIRSLSLTTI